jgi:hypothetical protein
LEIQGFIWRFKVHTESGERKLEGTSAVISRQEFPFGLFSFGDPRFHTESEERKLERTSVGMLKLPNSTSFHSKCHQLYPTHHHARTLFNAKKISKQYFMPFLM